MKPFCILGIDPVARGCWFAVWDREIGLVDYGTCTSHSAGPHRIVLQKLLNKHKPDLVLIESADGSRRRRKFRRVAESLNAYLGQKGVRVARVNRQLKLSDGSNATKWEAAVALAGRHPELSSRVPERRKAWMNEDKRMNLFDALALIENYLAHEQERATADPIGALSD